MVSQWVTFSSLVISRACRLASLGLVLIGLVTALAGCQKVSAEQTVLDAGIAFEQPVAAQLPAPTSYRVGINTEVTGTGAQIGDLSIRAARLAIEEINTAGGINGIPLELVVRDARSDPTTALEQYEQAVAEDDLDALLGPFKSAYGMLIVPAHIDDTLPMFIGATNATLTERGDEHLFRMRPSDRLTAPAMLNFALQELKARRVGIVHDSDAFGTGGANRIEEGLVARGQPAAVRVGYATGTVEFDSVAQELAEAEVDTVLIYGTNQTDVGHLLRAIRYWDVDVPVVTSPSGASIVTRNVAGEAQDGIYAVIDATLQAWPKGQHFEESFQARFGLQPDTYIIWYYDAIHLLATIWQAHPEARGTELSRLIRESHYQGAQGLYCFDATGEGLHDVTIAQVIDGDLSLLLTYGDGGFEDFDRALARAGCGEGQS